MTPVTEHWFGAKLPYGWAGEYSIPNTTNFDHHMQLYQDIVYWIRANIQTPYANACWTKIGDCIYVQIRKPKDYTLFLLKWSAN